MTQEYKIAYQTGNTVTAKVYRGDPPALQDTVVLSDGVFDGIFEGDAGISLVAGDWIVYYDGTTIIGAETYQPESSSAADIIAALKAEDSWLTASGSGSLTFQQIIKILTAWAVGNVVDSGVAGMYDILDPEDDSTIILKVTPSESTPYKDIDIQ
jgi:hypothetical protein